MLTLCKVPWSKLFASPTLFDSIERTKWISSLQPGNIMAIQGSARPVRMHCAHHNVVLLPTHIGPKLEHSPEVYVARICMPLFMFFQWQAKVNVSLTQAVTEMHEKLSSSIWLKPLCSTNLNATGRHLSFLQCLAHWNVSMNVTWLSSLGGIETLINVKEVSAVA